MLRAARLSAVLLLLPVVAIAHGEAALGPHGGFVRMPGRFHTELLDKGGGTLAVFLLDSHFEHATTERSSVKLRFVPTSGKPSFAKCSAAGDLFTCAFKRLAATAVGKMQLDATRAGTTGKAAVYPYPLKLEARDHKPIAPAIAR